MKIDALYQTACKHEPYEYQRILAEDTWPDLLDIPTGLGKTAAVTLAWVFKRDWGSADRSPDPETPRRLIWCLPMRVLVEQTHEAICDWLKNLGVYGDAGDPNKIAVHVLMGGEDGMRGWAQHPEQDQIIIGTQDMLLSRALMRGYGMSRYQWPMDFALLHNDAMWVFDEVQLMGAGLATSTQLEAFRRTLPLSHGSRSLWVSATLNSSWLDTVDFRQHLQDLTSLSLPTADRNNSRVQKRLNAHKSLQTFDSPPLSAKLSDIKNYLEELAKDILKNHTGGGPTLAVLNTVERAQTLAGLIQKHKSDYPLLVVHSRFRAAERQHLNTQIRALTANSNTIIVATQAIEAGVDLTAARLYTELAPWSSLVQRFGRDNRGGEFENSQITWIDLEDEKLAAPYSADALTLARNKLADLISANGSDLPATDEDKPLVPVVRRRDLFSLFDTDPDLSGFDVDISAYIRDNDGPTPISVFWRDLANGSAADEPAPQRAELCPVSINQLSKHLGTDKIAWQWDTLAKHWQALRSKQLRPGMTLLLACTDGGYDEQLGFVPKHNPKRNYQLAPIDITPHEASGFGVDTDSKQSHAVELTVHLDDVHREAQALTVSCNTDHAAAIHTAALWHDVGKSHSVFQHTLRGDTEDMPLLAKSTQPGKHERPYFRHELASMLSWLSHGKEHEQCDLIAYLIAAHHGKVRMSIRALPDEKPPKDQSKRYARGIHEGDELPEIQVGTQNLPTTILSLAVMELGDSEEGASWISRTQQLLDHHGPFVLAWLETLIRIADWRASDKPSQTLPQPTTEDSQ